MSEFSTPDVRLRLSELESATSPLQIISLLKLTLVRIELIVSVICSVYIRIELIVGVICSVIFQNYSQW